MTSLWRHNLIDLGVLAVVSLGSWAAIMGWPTEAAVIIALLSMLQLARFLWSTFKRVHKHLKHEGASLLHCLLLLAAMALYFVFAYGLTYAFLVTSDADAMKNFADSSFWARLLDGWYFSTVTFTATGFGEIVPMTFAGKSVVWGQMVLGYATSVFAISSFISLTDKEQGDDSESDESSES